MSWTDVVQRAPGRRGETILAEDRFTPQSRRERVTFQSHHVNIPREKARERTRDKGGTRGKNGAIQQSARLNLIMHVTSNEELRQPASNGSVDNEPIRRDATAAAKSPPGRGAGFSGEPSRREFAERASRFSFVMRPHLALAVRVHREKP